MSEPFTLNIAASKVSPDVLATLTRFAAAANAKDWSALRALVAESPLAASGLTTDQLSPAIFLPYAEHVGYKAAVGPALCMATQETGLEVSLEAEPKLKLSLEGSDHDGDGLCVFFLQWLASVGLAAFEATARSSHGWSAKWSQDANGLSLVKHKLPTGQEDDAAVFAKRRAAAETSTCGFLIKAFKDTLGGDFNRLVSTLQQGSVLQLPFSKIIDKLASVKRLKHDTWYSDDRFALRPLDKQVLSAEEAGSLHLGRINGFQLEETSPLGRWNFDFAAALAHVEQVITQPLYREVSLDDPEYPFAEFHWAVGDISATLTMIATQVRFCLKRFPDLSTLPPARMYALYKDGMQPDALHWQQLLAKAEAPERQADADSLFVLGELHLYNFNGLVRDADRAQSLYMQAAERGSTAAMRTLGEGFFHADRLRRHWPKDLHKAHHYLQMGAAVGEWRCKELLPWVEKRLAEES